MPAPPKKGETKKQFLGRCIPVFVKEGKSQDQASAICFDMWRDRGESEGEDTRREDELLERILEENEWDERTKKDTFKLYKLEGKTIKARFKRDRRTWRRTRN